MKRGDVVTVAISGDYGKPRPAVIVQSDALPDTHSSIVICQMTTSAHPDGFFRVAIEPTPDNGLRALSHIMADKPMTLRRERVGSVIGRLSRSQVRELNSALAFALGLAD